MCRSKERATRAGGDTAVGSANDHPAENPTHRSTGKLRPDRGMHQVLAVSAPPLGPVFWHGTPSDIHYFAHRPFLPRQPFSITLLMGSALFEPNRPKHAPNTPASPVSRLAVCSCLFLCPLHILAVLRKGQICVNQLAARGCLVAVRTRSLHFHFSVISSARAAIFNLRGAATRAAEAANNI